MVRSKTTGFLEELPHFYRIVTIRKWLALPLYQVRHSYIINSHELSYVKNTHVTRQSL
jgi:hypothetical protein